MPAPEPSSPDLLRITIEVPEEDLPRAEVLLEAQGFGAWEIQDRGTLSPVAASDAGEDPLPAGRLRLLLYAERSALAERLCRSIGADFPGASCRVSPFSDRAWTERWKDFIPATVVAGRIVIRPPFRPSPSPELPEIVIDPGMAFGTGAHETTRLACGLAIEAMDALLEGGGSPPRAADVGTGTGVIAAALSRLGCPEVWACDVDPEAIRVAAEVLEGNGLGGRVALVEGSAGVLSGGFQLVVANILADVLLSIAPDLSRICAPGGSLVLSGVLATEEEAFLIDLLRIFPGRLSCRAQMGEWVGFSLLRGEGP